MHLTRGELDRLVFIKVGILLRPASEHCTQLPLALVNLVAADVCSQRVLNQLAVTSTGTSHDGFAREQAGFG
jgi:hypothetical protein